MLMLNSIEINSIVSWIWLFVWHRAAVFQISHYVVQGQSGWPWKAAQYRNQRLEGYTEK